MEFARQLEVISPHHEANDYVDPWHYVGFKEELPSSMNREFINLCRATLSKKNNVNIRVGSTGYVEPTGDIEGGRYWTLDTFGRFVAVIDNILVFQRFQQGDTLVYGKLCGPYNNLADASMVNTWKETLVSEKLPELESVPY